MPSLLSKDQADKLKLRPKDLKVINVGVPDMDPKENLAYDGKEWKSVSYNSIIYFLTISYVE